MVAAEPTTRVPKQTQSKLATDSTPSSRLPLFVIMSLLWLALMVAVAISAQWLAPYPVEEMSLRDRLAPPGTPGYWLGTDKLGRDILSRLIFSIQISMFVAVLGTLTGGLLGTLVGLLAAHFRGIVDDAVMLLIDFQASLPFLIFALAILAFVGNSLTIFILVLGILGWETYARLARGMTLAAKEQGYVEAGRALGTPSFQIYLRHILPNIANTLIVALTLNFPGTILAEAGLSFLGLGVQPPLTSLGLMLSIGRDYLSSAWWIAVFPGTVIFITTLSISLLGDWLRDQLDPLTHE